MKSTWHFHGNRKCVTTILLQIGLLFQYLRLDAWFLAFLEKCYDPKSLKIPYDNKWYYMDSSIWWFIAVTEILLLNNIHVFFFFWKFLCIKVLNTVVLSKIHLHCSSQMRTETRPTGSARLIWMWTWWSTSAWLP